MRLSRFKVFRLVPVCLAVALAANTQALEIAVGHVDLPPCDPLVVPRFVDELGPGFLGFPPDEEIAFDPTFTEPEPNCSNIFDVGFSYEIFIVNNTGRAFTKVWFVADSDNFWVGNYDGLVQDAPAMLIDRDGINRPLVFESIAPNQIFEPGEVWQFRVYAWVGPPALMLGSPGRVGMDSIVLDDSNASIIGIPEEAQEPGMTFSFDFHGPMNGMPDGFGFRPIYEGDIVTPALPGPPGPNNPAPGPLPPPGLQIGSTAHLRMLGLVPGMMPPWRNFPATEIDALSYGTDEPERGRIRFSVDEFAEGDPRDPSALVPEGPLGGMAEAAADTFDYRGTDGMLPNPPPAPPIVYGNTYATDGDGNTIPGVGLIEPNPPIPFGPDDGDNLDAVDFFTQPSQLNGPVFFSLDSRFFDPIEQLPNMATASANFFVGGDVLVVYNTTTAVTTPVLYAPAPLLGLDIIAGPDSDDLDALALFESGDGEYVPGEDIILFSVRRGSAIIGVPDSRLGLPITPGDILMPPAAGAALPGIYIPAEKLGLKTARSGDQCAVTYPTPPVPDPEQLCDDLNALDRLPLFALDSDGDGVTDDVDNCWYEVNPSQLDTNGDGIGNRCDPDIFVPNNCQVNAGDLGTMKAAFFSTPGSPNWNPDADLDGDGTVSFPDLGIMKQYFFGPPGPSGQPNACDCT